MQEVKALLVWYFRLAASGPWEWTEDNRAEVENIINIIDARFARLEKRVQELEALVAGESRSDGGEP